MTKEERMKINFNGIDVEAEVKVTEYDITLIFPENKDNIIVISDFDIEYIYEKMQEIKMFHNIQKSRIKKY